MDAYNTAEDEADTAHGNKPGPRPALAGTPVFSNQPTNPGRRAGSAGMTTGTTTGAARTRQRATSKAKATGTEPAPTKTKITKTRKTRTNARG